MIYAALPLTSPHVSEAYFNKRYVVLVIPRKSAHCWPRHTFLELCFAKKPGACQTRKMLLLVPEGNSVCVGIKSHAFMVKNVEVIGQTMVFCFQKREATLMNLVGLKTEVSEDLISYSWWQIFLLTYSKQAEEAALLFLSLLFHPDGQNCILVCSGSDNCRSIFGPANFSLKQFIGYKCVMITVVTFVIHLH